MKLNSLLRPPTWGICPQALQRFRPRMDAVVSGNVSGVATVPVMSAQRVDRLAIIPISGVIMDVDAAWELYGFCSLDRVRADIDAAAADADLVLFVIDSPGGDVTGVGELAERIAALPASAAYTSGMALSCGYWLAAATGFIMATPSASVGSIGVISEAFDSSEQARAQGLAVETRTSAGAERKALYGFGHQWTEEDRAFVEARLESAAAPMRSFIFGRRGELPQGDYYRADAAPAGFVDLVAFDGKPLDTVERAVAAWLSL